MSGRLVPFALLVAIVTGCGGGDGAASPADAVKAYNRAVADGDGGRACAQLDRSAQEELQQAAQGAIRDSCKQIIDTVAAFYDESAKRRLREADVSSEPQGDQAIATFAAPTALGGADRPQTYHLRKVGGDWKIASLGIRVEGP
jgi:hypothetical protein